jgi:BirA family transcriptional regulator, biotin operon repressor / biotin---[acetyl-CoA-carboxylase] ligase
LAEFGLDIAPGTMLDALSASIQHWLAIWEAGESFTSIREAWLARAGSIGEGCSVNTGTDQIAGTFLGLDANGALLLRDEQGRQRTISFGDVTLAWPPAGGQS